jgi:hypothetical protein
MFSNPWLQYVKLYQKKHPELSYKEVLQEAPVSYKKLKKQYGGNGIGRGKKVWTNPVTPNFIENLPCFKDGLKEKDREDLLRPDTVPPYTFIVRKSSLQVKTIPGSTYSVLATWAITYFDDKKDKLKNVICVHTQNGFTAKEQNKFFDTIGDFLSVAIDNVGFKAYDIDSGDYTPDQEKQVKIFPKKEPERWAATGL